MTVRTLIFDTETTGLPLHPDARVELQPRIIEIGALLVERDCVLQEYERLVNPGIALPPEITRITGLTDEALVDAPQFPALAEEWRALLAAADAVVAHNLPFDTAMFDFAAARHALAPWQWPARRICTVQEHAEEWGRRPKLKELYEHYAGEPLAQKHRALDDVRALFRVCLDSGVLQ